MIGRDPSRVIQEIKVSIIAWRNGMIIRVVIPRYWLSSQCQNMIINCQWYRLSQRFAIINIMSSRLHICTVGSDVST
jgi:hypothetical protein